MKKMIMGLSLLATMSSLAGDYATTFPTNSKRIASLVNLKTTTKKLVSKSSKLYEKSAQITMLSGQSKINFCMTLAEVNILSDQLRSEIDTVTPPAPYMLNHEQDDILTITSTFLNKVNSNHYTLSQYCKGAYKVKVEERQQLIREITSLGMDTNHELKLIPLSDSLLSPMTIEEMQQVSSQTEEVKEEAKKECTFF